MSTRRTSSRKAGSSADRKSRGRKAPLTPMKRVKRKIGEGGSRHLQDREAAFKHRRGFSR